jgi:hypothetical protein
MKDASRLPPGKARLRPQRPLVIQLVISPPFAGMTRIRFCGCVLSLDDEAPRSLHVTIGA